MATAESSEYVELVGTSSTLLIGSKGIKLVGYEGLVEGPTRGSDLTYAQQDGADAYPRFRGPMTPSLSLRIMGQWDQDGAVQSFAQWISNSWTMFDVVNEFPASEDYEFDLRWVRPHKTVSAPARFERFGVWERPLPHIHDVDVLLTVPSGVLVVEP